MRFLPTATTLVLAAVAAAQSITVSNVADSGAGSLRAALLAANSAGGGTFTIGIAAGGTAGPIVLASMLPALTRSNVTITQLPGAGRLIIDATNATNPGWPGLEMDGAADQLLAPTRVLTRGHGVQVRGPGSRVADLETNGSLGGYGLGALAGADDLVVGRLVADAFQQGLLLQDCRRAHVADDGVAVATLTNCSQPGVLIINGSDHSLGSLVCTADSIGVSAQNCPDLRLGRAGLPRTLIQQNRAQGFLLRQCDNATLTNADVMGNGASGDGFGVHVMGGANLRASDLRLETNWYGGLLLEAGVVAARIGPLVTTRGLSTLSDFGLDIRHATAVTVVDCTFGPTHMVGVRMEPEGVDPPADVTFCRCSILGNRTAGLSMSRSLRTLVSSCTVSSNLSDAIWAVGASVGTGPQGVVIADCTLSNNAGSGVVAAGVDGIQVGPGNRCDDNTDTGVSILNSVGAVIRDNLSIDRNRSSGIYLQESDDSVVERTQLRDNRVAGIWAADCARVTIGPDLAVRGTLGTGISLEGCDGCRIVSTQVTSSTGNGVQISPWLSWPATTPHVLQSCLLADNQGLALLHTWPQSVICSFCTIAGNLRGVDCGANPLTIDSCVVYDNLIEDLQHTATALTVRNSLHLNPPPAANSNNSNADPCFVDPLQHDWRLQPWSPAVGYANVALTVIPGDRDAYGGPRSVGAPDAGAYEVGPHSVDTSAHLSLATPVMAHGGGGMAFHLQYAPNAAGTLSLLLLQIGPPSGSFPLLGTNVPIGLAPELMLAATDPLSRGTFALVPPGGLVAGALLWGGEIPASVQNLPISLCAVALDGIPSVRAVSDVASFTIQ